MSIDLTTMVEKKVSVKGVKVHVKVGDRGSYEFITTTGETVKDMQSEYVPDFFPDDHYGDYLILNIDLATGQIINWNPPTADQLEELFNGEGY